MRSYPEIDATLTAPSQPFEIETVSVRGVATRDWKDAPASLRAVLDHSRDTHRTSDFIVLGDERVGHDEHHRRVARFAGRLVDDSACGPATASSSQCATTRSGRSRSSPSTAIGAVAVPAERVVDGR